MNIKTMTEVYAIVIKDTEEILDSKSAKKYFPEIREQRKHSYIPFRRKTFLKKHHLESSWKHLPKSVQDKCERAIFTFKETYDE